ncbi:MAG: alpha-mannosidase, partial [Ruminococcaceae bacterium]|nr:alpha-mannosidase [Oscillospiraceae bacterium]
LPICYREPYWYNAAIEPDMLWDIPMQCKEQGIGCMLKVYGVGDHGGGPTRRDVESLIEMASWPIMPTVLFSTYKAFFAELEQFRANLTVLEGEQNFLFNGCYTSQAKIKLANRIAEDRIAESEALDTEALLAGAESFADSFRTAWKDILFNHFHDILPGSGVVDTREYAMGRFQEAMAHIGTSANLAMRSIARCIDTTSVALKDDPASRSVGAGAGYGVEYKAHYGMPSAERGMGKTRLFHLFNPTQYDYDGVVELTVWDWHYNADRAVFTAANGEIAAAKLIGEGKKSYWGHQFKTFALCAGVPAFGYASYTLTEAPAVAETTTQIPHQRVIIDTDDDLVLENELIRAAFDHETMELCSLLDKKSDKELIKAPAGIFRLITENDRRGMTAWYVGEYAKVEALNKTCPVRIKEIKNKGVRQWIDFEFKFAERSKLSARVLVDAGSPMVQFDVTVDFHELGNKEKGIPQLNFALPLAYESEQCRFDVPFGTLDRAPLDYDVPASSFAVPLAKDGTPSLMLVSDSKYGFRYTGDAVTLSLIRASYNPDPYPEYGLHHFRLGVGVCADTEAAALYRVASGFVHPISYCTADLHERGGELPLEHRFLTVKGKIRITALKTAENGEDVVVRFHNNGDTATPFALSLASKPIAAFATDINEKVLEPLPVQGNAVVGECPPFAIRTVLIKRA